MLQLGNAPRGPKENLLMAGTDQQQVRQYRYTKGFLDPSLLPTHLVLAQAQVGLEFSIDLLYGPSSLVGTDYLSRDPLVQIGHQDFRMFRADVTPSFTQDHSDVTDVPQTQACAIHPEGFPAPGTREARDQRALIIFVRQMPHQVFDRFILDRFPRPGNGEYKAPPTRRIVGVTLHHHLHVVLRAIGRVALDNDARGPGRRDKASDHLTKQRIFRLVLRMGFHPYQPKGHGEAIDVPRGDQQGKTNPEKPGLMLTLASLLGQRIPCPPLGLHTAIPDERERPVLGWGQGLQGFLNPPRHQQMDVPIGRLEHTAKAPHRDLGWRPAGQFFQGFPPWVQGLHEDQPTQDEAMPAFPEAGHAAKQDRDKKGQIGDRDHGKPPWAKGGGDQASGIPAVLFYHTFSSTLISKASWVEDVVF